MKLVTAVITSFYRLEVVVSELAALVAVAAVPIATRKVQQDAL